MSPAWRLLLLSLGALAPVQGTQTIDDVVDIFGDKLHVLRPGYGGPPVEVKVSMYITDVTMSGFRPVLRFVAYVRQHWKDNRLSFNDSNKSIGLSGEDISLIWTPDLFFSNLVDGFMQDIFQENVMVRISPNGRILLSQRVSVEIRCPLDLRHFPADTQMCSFNMESYAHTTNDMTLMWMDGDPINLSPDVSIPQFSFSNVNTSYRQNVFSTGRYQKLVASMHFARHMGGHVAMFHCPSILLVIVSWTSFWLHLRVAHARILMSILLLLGHMALAVLPRALLIRDLAYMTLVDVWMGIGTTFIFLALIETVAVLFLHRDREGGPSADGVNRPEDGGEAIPMTDFLKPGNSLSKRKLGSAKLDFVSRILFPALYLLINIIYWSYLSSLQ